MRFGSSSRQPGYVWLDMGKVRSVGEHDLGLTHERLGHRGKGLAPCEREPGELLANVLQALAQTRGFAAQIGGRVSQGDALTLETA